MDPFFCRVSAGWCSTAVCRWLENLKRSIALQLLSSAANDMHSIATLYRRWKLVVKGSLQIVRNKSVSAPSLRRLITPADHEAARSWCDSFNVGDIPRSETISCLSRASRPRYWWKEFRCNFSHICKIFWRWRAKCQQSRDESYHQGETRRKIQWLDSRVDKGQPQENCQW